jgi:DNA-binding transcriptional regulator YiaG
MTERPYHYRESGLDSVYLMNGFVIRETERGQLTNIADIDGLHQAIGRVLLDERKRLSGKEFRFLRHELGMSQSVLAELIGTDEQTVARWEKGQTKAPKTAEATLRLLYEEKLNGNVRVSETLRRIADLEASLDRRMEFVETDQGWDVAA